MRNGSVRGTLLLEDGSLFEGWGFGFPRSVSGEVVFNTGMVGYTEALTDPSYRGQILVLTYPLVGNYGVPELIHKDQFESQRIQVAGLIVSKVCREPSHRNAATTLSQWLQSEGVPALTSVDTRALTKRLRTRGTMMGSIGVGLSILAVPEVNRVELVSEVTVPAPITYSGGRKKVVLIDCGCKENIVRNLLQRNITV